MADTPQHGALFDRFSARASNTHGGSYFDAGFGEQTLSDAHGRLYELFGLPKDSTAHGARFDEFGWTAMPATHSQQFDSDFRLDGDSGHGHGTTWFDTFRGGTQVRFMYGGKDYEGVVDHVEPGFATVRSTDGRTLEVGLSQFTAYRTPNEQQASPSIPESEADAPSVRSDVAHGGGERSAPSTEMLPVVGEVPQGGVAGVRAGLPAGLMDTFDRLKSLVDDDDVQKAMTGRPDCSSPGCAAPARVIVQKSATSKPTPFCHVHAIAQGAVHSWHEPSSAHMDAWPAKAIDIALSVLKEVTTVETATQKQDLEGDVKPVWCAHCHKKVDGDKDKCPTCGGKVTVSKAFGSSADALPGGQTVTVDPHSGQVGGKHQATSDPAGPDVPERADPSPDGGSRGRCPHCGAALDELDEKTEQGQPKSRKVKQGATPEFSTVEHKCLAGSLDVLKSVIGAAA